MIENLIPKDEHRELSESYKLRSGFWAVSVGAHIVWIFIATQIHLTPKPLRPIYDEFIRPLERKVLVYRPPKKTAAATPETRVGSTIDPRGAAKAIRAIIATAPQAKSQKQIIIRPLPELQVDVPAPNVVARIEAALPPPPPKVQAKTFTAPVVSQQRVAKNFEISAALPAAPTVTDAVNNPAPSKATLTPPPKIAPKQFTPPPASARQPKLATPTEVSEALVAEPLVTASTGGPVISTRVLPPAPKTPPKQFKAPTASGGGKGAPSKDPEITATLAAAPTVSPALAGPMIPALTNPRLSGPPRDVPPASEPTRGNDKANIAIANVNPNPSAAIPAGSRPGQFSVAPVVGEPSSGAAAPSALVVPNLAVRDPVPRQADPAKSNTVIYAEKVRSSATGAFAVPLRPAANRSIPRAVDARFSGRSVYTVLIPIENLPAYGADWILWFAEVAPLPGQTPSVKGPVPFRKIELVEKNRDATDTRLQIAATLGVDGKLSNLKMLSTVSASTLELALEDLGSWEWKPATRNGVAIAIEAVFEIPFRLPKRP